MCPGRLVDSPPDASASDDDFDRHGRIRRRAYSDSEDSDADRLVASPVEMNGHAERLPSDPGQTSLANGGGVSGLDGEASQTSPMMRFPQERGANAAENRTTSSNARIMTIYLYSSRNHALGLSDGESPREFIHHQVRPLLSALGACVLVTEGEPAFPIRRHSDLQVIESIVQHLQIVWLLARLLP
ncbi:hypothetical protein F4824DRAFT_496503 [Ustulina deusta]|nr:hypothetical protein F4824DRAFT_496503 [Ustulina deusta]